MNNLVNKLITFVIICASIYTFYQNNYFWGVFFALWGVLRLFNLKLERITRAIREIFQHNDIERKCNVAFEMTINIQEVIEHELVGKYFERLKKQRILDKSAKLGSWQKTMLKNYQSKYDREDHFERIQYNIKGGFLWKNGEVEFIDELYHEIAIPFKYDANKSDDDFIKTDGLTIRVLSVNGFLKLEIGNYSKDLSPELIRDKGLAVFITHETITSFPLMYFAIHHGIPEKYLGLSMYATESYKDLHRDNHKGNWTRDWKELQGEISDYNYICGIDENESIEGDAKSHEIIKRFSEQKQKFLEANEFTDPFSISDWDLIGLPERPHYQNKYLCVYICDLNQIVESRKQYVYTDYYEERP